jgi:hypothetical protein
MCHGHRRHGRHGRHGFRRFGNREEWLERLEQYQRDLEQELADVSDVLKRLREGKLQETATV